MMIFKKKDIIFFGIFFLLCLIASYLRAFQIETRPLHSDESVNFLFVEQINQLGYFPYSHENYHGPSFFYITTELVNLINDGIFGIRSCSIFAGILSVVFLLGFIMTTRKSFILFSAALVAFSPSLVFFSRYAIHEPLLVLGGLIFALSLYNWHILRKAIWIYIGGLGLCLMVTTKETFIITVFAVFCSFFILILGNYQKVIKDIMLQKIHVFFCLLMLIFFTAAIYSAGFRWHTGMVEFFFAFPQWFARNDTDIGHHKPFDYYFNSIILKSELAIPIIFALAIIFYLLLFCASFVWREKIKIFLKSYDPLLLFLASWTLITFFVYSFIKYKTVWLLINFTFPAQLFIGKFFSGIFELPQKTAKFIALTGLAVVLFFQAQSTLKFNFSMAPIPGTNILLAKSIPYGPGNPFSYVHTSPGTLSLVGDLLAYIEKKPNAKILMGIDGYFPIPYYMRKSQKQIAYTTNFNLIEALNYYDVLVLDYYKNNLLRAEFDKKYYRLSDYKESFTYFRKINK